MEHPTLVADLWRGRFGAPEPIGPDSGGFAIPTART
jgi:hypothetical protein